MSKVLAGHKVRNSFDDVRRNLQQLADATAAMHLLLNQIEEMNQGGDVAGDNHSLAAIVRKCEHNLDPSFMQNPARSVSVFSKQVEEAVYSLMLAALKA
jgi:hypothetical protein